MKVEMLAVKHRKVSTYGLANVLVAGEDHARRSLILWRRSKRGNVCVAQHRAFAHPRPSLIISKPPIGVAHENAVEIQLTDKATGSRGKKLLDIRVWLDWWFFGLGHMSLVAWMGQTANQSTEDYSLKARKNEPAPPVFIERLGPSTPSEIKVRTGAGSEPSANRIRRLKSSRSITNALRENRENDKDGCGGPYRSGLQSDFASADNICSRRVSSLLAAASGGGWRYLKCVFWFR